MDSIPTESEEASHWAETNSVLKDKILEIMTVTERVVTKFSSNVGIKSKASEETMGAESESSSNNKNPDLDALERRLQKEYILIKQMKMEARSL